MQRQVILLVLVLAGCQAPRAKPVKEPPWRAPKQTLKASGPTSNELWKKLLRARKARKDVRDVLKRLRENEHRLEVLMPKAIKARLEFQKAIQRTNEHEYQKFYVAMDKERKRRAAPESIWHKKRK